MLLSQDSKRKVLLALLEKKVIDSANLEALTRYDAMLDTKPLRTTTAEEFYQHAARVALTIESSDTLIKALLDLDNRAMRRELIAQKDSDRREILSLSALQSFITARFGANPAVLMNRWLMRSMAESYVLIHQLLHIKMGYEGGQVVAPFFGGDISSAAYLTNAQRYKVFDSLPFGNNERIQDYQDLKIAYQAEKLTRGFNATSLIQAIGSAKIILLWELEAMGVDLNEVDIKKGEGEGVYLIHFPWSYDGKSKPISRQIEYHERKFGTNEKAPEGVFSSEDVIYLVKANLDLGAFQNTSLPPLILSFGDMNLEGYEKIPLGEYFNQFPGLTQALSTGYAQVLHRVILIRKDFLQKTQASQVDPKRSEMRESLTPSGETEGENRAKKRRVTKVVTSENIQKQVEIYSAWELFKRKGAVFTVSISAFFIFYLFSDGSYTQKLAGNDPNKQSVKRIIDWYAAGSAAYFLYTALGFLKTFAHEVGHRAAAWLMNVKAVGYVIWPSGGFGFVPEYFRRPSVAGMAIALGGITAELSAWILSMGSAWFLTHRPTFVLAAMMPLFDIFSRRYQSDYLQTATAWKGIVSLRAYQKFFGKENAENVLKLTEKILSAGESLKSIANDEEVKKIVLELSEVIHSNTQPAALDLLKSIFLSQSCQIESDDLRSFKITRISDGQSVTISPALSESRSEAREIQLSELSHQLSARTTKDFNMIHSRSELRSGNDWLKKDPYEILRVSRTATQDEIKMAYRKLAIEFHPDKKPNDRAAEERFKEVAAAYEMLSAPDKKKGYDDLEKSSTNFSSEIIANFLIQKIQNIDPKYPRAFILLENILSLIQYYTASLGGHYERVFQEYDRKNDEIKREQNKVISAQLADEFIKQLQAINTQDFEFARTELWRIGHNIVAKEAALGDSYSKVIAVYQEKELEITRFEQVRKQIQAKTLADRFLRILAEMNALSNGYSVRLRLNWFESRMNLQKSALGEEFSRVDLAYKEKRREREGTASIPMAMPWKFLLAPEEIQKLNEEVADIYQRILAVDLTQKTALEELDHIRSLVAISQSPAEPGWNQVTGVWQSRYLHVVLHQLLFIETSSMDAAFIAVDNIRWRASLRDEQLERNVRDVIDQAWRDKYADIFGAAIEQISFDQAYAQLDLGWIETEISSKKTELGERLSVIQSLWQAKADDLRNHGRSELRNGVPVLKKISDGFYLLHPGIFWVKELISILRNGASKNLRPQQMEEAYIRWHRWDKRVLAFYAGRRHFEAHARNPLQTQIELLLEFMLIEILLEGIQFSFSDWFLQNLNWIKRGYEESHRNVGVYLDHSIATKLVKESPRRLRLILAHEHFHEQLERLNPDERRELQALYEQLRTRQEFHDAMQKSEVAMAYLENGQDFKSPEFWEEFFVQVFYGSDLMSAGFGLNQEGMLLSPDEGYANFDNVKKMFLEHKASMFNLLPFLREVDRAALAQANKHTAILLPRSEMRKTGVPTKAGKPVSEFAGSPVGFTRVSAPQESTPSLAHSHTRSHSQGTFVMEARTLVNLRSELRDELFATLSIHRKELKLEVVGDRKQIPDQDPSLRAILGLPNVKVIPGSLKAARKMGGIQGIKILFLESGQNFRSTENLKAVQLTQQPGEIEFGRRLILGNGFFPGVEERNGVFQAPQSILAEIIRSELRYRVVAYAA